MQDGYNTHCDSGRGSAWWRFLGVEEVVGSNPAAPTISGSPAFTGNPVKAYFLSVGKEVHTYDSYAAFGLQ